MILSLQERLNHLLYITLIKHSNCGLTVGPLIEVNDKTALEVGPRNFFLGIGQGW